MSYAAFGGRVVFHMRPQTLGTDIEADALEEKIIKGAKIQDQKHKNVIETTSYLVAMTEKIEFAFDGKEKQALLDFREWWQNIKTMSPAEWWARRVELPHSIFKEWDIAYDTDQSLFEVPADHLPTGDLTAAQQEAAKDPDSPLAETGQSLPAA